MKTSVQQQVRRLTTVPAKATYLRRKLYAWWEGYAFDEEVERAAIASQYHGDKAALQSPETIIAQSIWGEGRFEPGSPAWTMRFARALNLPLRANVMVFGADAGACLEDLKHGTRWKVSGFTRYDGVSRRNLSSYEAAARKLHKASAAGAISFFELHRDSDPTAFAGFAGDVLLPGAKAVFVDFTVPRRTARLRGCFPASSQGAPRTIADFSSSLRNGGFSLVETDDESAAYIEMITKGWAGWRSAYNAIQTIENLKYRAELVKALGDQATLWANRLDAIKAGQLQVTRFHVIKS